EHAVAQPEGLRQRFESAFHAAWNRDCESDALNGLVITAGLQWEQVVILRSYVRYLQQTGSSLGLEFVEAALLRNPHLARMVVELFEVRFDPAAEEGRRDRQETVAARARQALDGVASLEEDRILRSLFGMVTASLRTNAYQRTPEGERLDRLAIKLDPQAIPDLPLPRPRFEIWVYSPRVEG
ncbi:MAG: NAD-glutamate dehydrogenase domain-containing protein, partial [Candidatus Nanopelagicales bacterium]